MLRRSLFLEYCNLPFFIVCSTKEVLPDIKIATSTKWIWYLIPVYGPMA